MLLFSFELVEDREWVLCNQPWCFDGHLFVVNALNEQPSAILLTSMSMWVRTSDVPLNLQTPEIIKSIASRVGVLKAYDVPHELYL